MIKTWIDFAKTNDYTIVCVMKDLEDKEIYPIFFKEEKDLEKHKNNIISESKVMIINIIFVENN